jgi:ParB/RepB/Spo0J family partition protein
MTNPLQPTAPPSTSAPYPPATEPSGPGISVMLPVTAIDPSPWRPRRSRQPTDPEDDLRLTASIVRHGVQQNLLVRPAGNGRYQLLGCDRRLRCAVAAGRTEVPAIVRPLDDHHARVLVLTEILRHRDRLHFLDQADAMAGLIDEGSTLPELAAYLRKPLSWTTRRHHLCNLTPAWRRLAEKAEGWCASWSAADFEQIALLVPAAQDDLLARGRPRLERCATPRELAGLIRSLTQDIATFPWHPGDAELHPPAGACAACPHRSSQHPLLLDGEESSADTRSPGPSRQPSWRRASDRCLNPLCAATKARLYLERRVATLAARYPRVLLLQEGWLLHDIPGALRAWQVIPIARRARGALPAVIANGRHLGKVLWVKLRDPRPPHPTPLPAGDPPPRRSRAPRQAARRRRRMIHAIRLLEAALRHHQPPGLSTAVRLAVVFGTAQAILSATFCREDPLPLLALAPDLAHQAPQVPSGGHRADPGATQDLLSTPGAAPLSCPCRPPDPAIACHPIPAAADSAARPSAPRKISAAAATSNLPVPPAGAQQPASTPDRPWRAFDALAGHEPAWAELLWARTLPVLLARMTPTREPRHIDLAWNEAARVAALVGLDAQTFLDQAATLFPDPTRRVRTRASANAPDTAASRGRSLTLKSPQPWPG